DAVDLNLGCPQGIARRGHYGAFLLEETDTVVAIVRALADGLAVPVTVKIRVLPTWEDTLRTVLALQAAGASAITVHGRT
ncbi:tRNA-dihydrouridine synthase, partial [Escherichia coli]|nr:tRNA-dihydrouridine synthase [Escherichia coli]